MWCLVGNGVFVCFIFLIVNGKFFFDMIFCLWLVNIFIWYLMFFRFVIYLFIVGFKSVIFEVSCIIVLGV